MKFGKKYLLILTIFLFSVSGLASAANYCVRAGATGSNNGSDWTNAYTALPSTLERGSTYYIADGTYSGYTFDDAVSGTSLITVKKAIASDHGTSTGWSSGYGDGLATFGSITFTTSYWVIDGQTGGGPGSWETGFGIKLDASGSKIVTLNNSAGNITLTHLDMEHNGRDTHNGNEDIVYALTASEDVTISYCYLHDVARCHLLTTSTDGLTIEYSKIARNGSGGDDIHREAWSAQVDDNVTVRYNIFEDISNTGILCLVNGTGDAENWQIYGNIFWRTPNDPSAVSAWVVTRYASPHFISAVNWKVYNNAIVNLQGLGAGLAIDDGSGNVAKNNIFYNNNVNIVQFNSTSHDYNWFEDNYRTDGCSPPCDLDPGNASSETNGIHGSADPFVDWENGDFDLTSGTDARDNGTDLGTSYDEDAYGNTRGADGYWDIGAYEYVSGANDTTAPSPDPMTWSTDPYATGTTSISMTATTATDVSGVEYYFDCTAGGGHDSGWQNGTTYEDTGLSASTQYTYRVKARDKSSNLNETAYSTTKSATTNAADTTAPSPDPMTWATEPYATGASSISMTATTATDASGVEYYFDCTAGDGHDSAWQDSTTYEDTGLSASTQYTYRVKARDKSSNLNETAYSTTKSATTDSASGTHINATFDSDADGFTYADITNGSYVDGSWDGSYGYSGGGIRVRTGPGPTGGATDGQYTDGFSLSSAGWVTITLRYRLEMGEGFESNEYGEAYLMIDSTRYGDGTGDSLVRIVGNGNGGGTDDSGWLSGEFDASLSSGSHTIKVGAYNNASTAADEWVNAYFDNVKVEDTNAPDTTAPTPDPMTWATDPYATGTTSISMTATTATDTSGVEYYFDCTAGGGHDSGWQDSTTYTDTGLSELTQYTYQVKARDKSSNQNETAYSTTKSATTQDGTAPSPDPMTFATDPYATGTTSISMTATTATDASGVEYYFDCTAGGGNDSGWQDSTTYQDTGLSASTQYTYRVQARDKSSNQNATGYSTTKSATTDSGVPNPVSWWKLDESSGTNADDSSGNNHDGTLSGGSWAPTSGKFDGAVDLGDSNNTDYVQVPTTGMSVSAGTVSVWGRIEGTQSGSRYFFGHTSGDWEDSIQLYMDNGDNNLDLGFGGVHPKHANIMTLSANTWYHIALTWDGTNYVVYVDGIEKASGTYTGLSTLNSIADIGNDGNTGYRIEAFQGLLDDVRIYDQALSKYDVAELAGITIASSPSPADEATGVSTTADLSWYAGYYAADVNGHDVYLGTDYNSVADANHSSSEYKGVQDSNSYDPGTMSASTTYYWAIDEVNDTNTWAGNVWSFTTSGGDTTAPSPDPMTWATEPYAAGASSISMTATTATDTSGVEYYFECTAGGGHSSSWQDSSTYQDTGLSELTEYTYRVKARDKSGNLNETGYSTTKSATTEDGTAPSPDPMTWATEPYAVSSSSISMTATTATDASGVEYYFDCTAGGGNDSGWQDSSTYQDTGLSELTEYTYRVKARDKSSNQNETGYSTTKSATTQDGTAPSPDPMTWATEPYATGASSISMTATTATDASGVEYYFDCTAGGGNDSGWQDSTSYTDTGLSELTEYTYRVKARDKSSNLNETAYSTTKSATTQDGTAPSPDPMTWSTEPYATGTSSISMTATTATDASGVEYYFDCTAGGGNDSGWQDSATYQDTGLSASTQYTYKVQSRDKSSNQNLAGWSTEKSATTDAAGGEPNLTGWWKLDETSGTTAADSSGNSYNGTVTGATWDSNGYDGGALNFDGTTTYRCEIPTGPLSVSASTISLWGRLEGTQSGARYFFGHNSDPNSDANWDDSIQLYMDNSDTVLDLGFGGVHPKHANIMTLSTNTWYNIALTWDGTNYAVYVDGVSKASGTYTGLNVLASIADIGNNGNRTQDTEGFAGLIDDVLIYDQALSKYDIADLAGITIASSPSPADNATDVSTTADLSWSAGYYAASTNGHDVYLGTDYNSVADANHSSSEFKGTQSSTTYDPGTLSASTTYYWAIDEVNDTNTWAGNVWSFTTSGGDTTAPSPDPMTWATEPYATGTSSIAMTATTATDASGVEYYFDCTAGGGNDSGWQDSTSYTDTGLSSSTQYTYQVKARDKSTNQNETAYSTTKSATTDAAEPNDIDGDTADTAVESDGWVRWGGETTSGVGGCSTDGHDWCTVFVFQLPTLGQGQTVTSANLKLYYEGTGYYTPQGNVDLHGLDYRTSSSVLSADFYQGSFTGDPNSTGIQDDIVTPSTSTGTINTSSSGDTAIKNYLNAQYTAGAEGGDFVFLRINDDIDETNDPQRFYDFSTANHGTSSQRPVLTVTIE